MLFFQNCKRLKLSLVFSLILGAVCAYAGGAHGKCLRLSMTKDQYNVNDQLLMAAKSGNQTAVDEAISRGADVNYCDDNDVTPLMAASYAGSASAARLLIEKGAEVNYYSEKSSTAMMIAVFRAHEEIVRILLKGGGSADRHRDAPKLSHKIPRKYDSASHFYSVGPTLGIARTASSKLSWSPLMAAAYSGSESIVALLMVHGANVNYGDRYAIALTCAIKRNFPNIVRLLIQNGTDIDMQNWCGETALMNAVKKGLVDVVRVLIENGANIHRMDGDHHTALTTALNSRELCSQVRSEIIWALQNPEEVKIEKIIRDVSEVIDQSGLRDTNLLDSIREKLTSESAQESVPSLAWLIVQEISKNKDHYLTR